MKKILTPALIVLTSLISFFALKEEFEPKDADLLSFQSSLLLLILAICVVPTIGINRYKATRSLYSFIPTVIAVAAMLIIIFHRNHVINL